MFSTHVNVVGIFNKNSYITFLINNDNLIWGYSFYLFLFLIVWLVFNIIISSLLNINIFNKKFFLNERRRNLNEILLKFLFRYTFAYLYKKILFQKLI